MDYHTAITQPAGDTENGFNFPDLTIRTKQIKSTMKTRRVNHGKTLNLNATIKSGLKMFAPTWAMVKAFKAGTLSAKDYTEQYTVLMRDSFKQHKAAWLELLKFKTIVIGCYCKKTDFCHRHLLAGMINKIASANKIDCYLVDECQQAD